MCLIWCRIGCWGRNTSWTRCGWRVTSPVFKSSSTKMKLSGKHFLFLFITQSVKMQHSLCFYFLHIFYNKQEKHQNVLNLNLLQIDWIRVKQTNNYILFISIIKWPYFFIFFQGSRYRPRQPHQVQFVNRQRPSEGTDWHPRLPGKRFQPGERVLGPRRPNWQLERLDRRGSRQRQVLRGWNPEHRKQVRVL